MTQYLRRRSGLVGGTRGRRSRQRSEGQEASHPGWGRGMWVVGWIVGVKKEGTKEGEDGRVE